MTRIRQSAFRADTSYTTNPEPFALQPVVLIGALLCLAVALGGGGVRYGLANLAIQLAALVVLAARRDAVIHFWRQAPLSLKGLAVLTLALPALHLLPVPESVWTALPGRDLVQQSFALAGRSGWAPASVDPVRTAVALTGMIVPATILMAGWSLSRTHLLLLGWLVVAIGLVNVLMGIPQVLSGGDQVTLYSNPALTDVLYGTFANRNSTGLFLVAALLLVAVLPSPIVHKSVLPMRIALCVLLITAVVLTRSRTALVLAAIPLLLAAIRSISWVRMNKSGSMLSSSAARRAVIGAAFLGIGAIASVLVMAPGRVGDTMERFQASSDARAYIWEDSLYSASRYWPVGAGMGTFDEVFQADESLENATERRAGRAHNDYLEVAIEAGLPGLILIALWLVLCTWLAWKARHSELRWVAWAGGGILLTIALQSVTDYPLRNQAMLAIGSFALLLLARIGTAKPVLQS